MFRAFGNSILWVAAACATGANKITHTVSGKGVVVIREISLVGAATLYRPFFSSPETAEAHASVGYSALVKAKLTGNPGLSPGRVWRQTVRFPGSSVNFFDFRPKILKMGPDAIHTKAYDIGYD